ncbi:protein IQ-DOMAIN 32-like isoform X2 [Abrus precatorius]|uniref:Protein IQ-DOMAIN 32-like isoform X2 n=2 Tax=Abrus precatorius TaxID=3816 RepID=A0A8B8LHH5_ABRPR|nr:protein IQ-DOMAIN 32-like isoform X2 [Abrus precatorius]
MGKSSSCFRLITCGGDAAEKDDYQVSEIMDSNDKRGWSFYKKSAKHRVLSNTVIAEAPFSANKESSECTNFNFQPLPEPNVIEKIYTTDFSDEKPQLSSFEGSQISETKVIATETKVDVNPPESSVIVIQSAIRGLLAQRKLLQLKNVVKLQAAVRGHLVRRHAVGTLRCFQAIIRMQALVRARYAQQSHLENHLNRKDGKKDSSKALGNEKHMTKSKVNYTSIEKLHSNRFAHQLLESTPKNKPIHVKCDPSKADSAWKWFERWMSVSSEDTAEHKETSSLTEQSGESKDNSSVFQFETGVQSEVFLWSADSKSTVGDSLLPSEDEEKLIIYDTNNFKFQASCSTSCIVKDDSEQVPPEETIENDAKVASGETDSFQNEKSGSDASALPELNSPHMKPEIAPPPVLNSLHQRPEIDCEQGKRSMKRLASDQLEAEGKKLVNGSRKVSNPAFIAAQSKFEELSSIANSGRTSTLSYQDAAVESQGGTPSVSNDTADRSKEFKFENPAPYLSRFGGSECGTELSISSTLDSPDISEAGAMENERDAKDLVEGIRNLENTINHDDSPNASCVIPASNPAISVLDQSEVVVVDDISGNVGQSMVAEGSAEPAIKNEKKLSDLQREQVEAVPQDLRSSPEASPRSHLTVPESQGTPSSQVSIKPKESKIDMNRSSKKRGTLSLGNKSPANPNHESGSRGSSEQLPKDQQNGKRRNSFGSVKPDHIDQEPRDNSSNNNSLPHFMQATESARAKINANNSPRSSPDVHERDIQVKKRHSLPGATGRQVSPRIQLSMSQAQQSAKGNNVHPPQERKWLR